MGPGFLMLDFNCITHIKDAGWAPLWAGLPLPEGGLSTVFYVDNFFYLEEVLSTVSM